MKNAFVKDSLRQVRATLNRFLSILVITALGVAVFAGLRASGPAMRVTASQYFDRLNFMDIRLVSTLGFNEGDIKAIRQTEGVSSVMPAYSYDALALLADKNLTVRLHSLSENTQNQINRPMIIAGRMPQNSGECLADARFMKLSGYQIGDIVRLGSGTASPLSDALRADQFLITGIAENPLYISFERGSSSVGSGKTDAYLLIPPADFKLPVYTEAYLTVENDDSLSRFDDRYADLIKPVQTALEKTGSLRGEQRYDEIKDEARQELDDAKKKLADGHSELQDAQKEIDAARVQLDKGWQEYYAGLERYKSETAAAQAKLDAGEARLEQGRRQYDEGLAQFEQKISAAEQELASGSAAYRRGKELYDTLTAALNAGARPESLAALRSIAAATEASQPQLAAALNAYAENPDDPQAVAAAQGAAQQFGQTLEQAKGEVDKGSARLQQERLQGRQELAAAEKQLLDSEQELSEGRAALEKEKAQGKQELDAALQELQDGEAKFLKGKNTFLQEQENARQELAEAQQKIDDGEKQLAELKGPQWYVLDHETNIGFAGYKQDARRIDALSLVIPLLFFLVAVLVTMTSMTRLVDSDRSYIGTLKAIGYGSGRIAVRYLLYAVAASIIGSVVGLIAGLNIFPRVVFNAYAAMYTLPPLQIQYDLLSAFISIALAVACAALPAYFVCIRSTREAPAELMRPAAPHIGKGALLERIPFIWNKFNFSRKVALRNLFRYKKRLFMTIIGVAGCTALMFTGFALRDSITTIVPKQYDNIQRFDLRLDLQQDISDTDRASLEETLKNNAAILSQTELTNQSVDVRQNDQLKSAFLIVPAEQSEFVSFVRFQNRETQELLRLKDDSVIITEKLAGLLNLREGSNLTIRDADGKEATVVVGGITENYLYHYVYMTPSLYRSLFKTEPAVNQALCRLQDSSGKSNDAISESLLEHMAVNSVTFTSNLEASAKKMVGALRYVVLVLISSAAALVFVVLFCLTSINLEERNRELATIKVLGFFNRELAAYIYRENVVLTLIGALAGLLLGIVLQRYILTTVEIDMIMFSRDILWPSYAYSAGLTILFAALANAIMFRHIARIDMVSSLKSIE